MKSIDRFLSNITMYSLLLYGLLTLALVSIVLSFFGLVPFSALSLLGSIVTLVLVAGIVNYILSLLFRVPLNNESSHISALILFFIMAPVTDLKSFYFLILVATLAMASKYIFNIHGKHIFNPAAIAVFILDIFGIGAAIWWVATPALAIPVIILGFFIVRKIKRFYLFLSFATTSLIVLSISQFAGLSSIFSNLSQFILSWPLVFLGTIMLTEPLTTPPKEGLRIIYGIIVGLLFSLQFNFGPIYATPEFALIVGNIFSYIVSFKYKIRFSFLQSEAISDRTYSITFKPHKKFSFKAGQYMEWTMPEVPFNLKGNRRYFTIASSPTEEEVHLGISYDPAYPSKFKEKLLSMKTGQKIVGHGVAGDFTLPENPREKLVFIAGGIGITPFRSMIKYLLDKEEMRDIILFYSVNTAKEIAYDSILREGEMKLGLKRINVITGEKNSNSPSVINTDLIKRDVPDFNSRLFYLSGPPGMVEAFKKMLQEMGIHQSKIKTDFFIGYA